MRKYLFLVSLILATFYLQARNAQVISTGNGQSVFDESVNVKEPGQGSVLAFNGYGIFDTETTTGADSFTSNKNSLQNYSGPVNTSSNLNVGNSQASLIFSEDFESGKMTMLRSGNYPTITNSPVRAGKYAMKTYLHYKNSPTNYRTEVYISDHDVIGDHYWYGFSIFLPNDYIPDNVWEIVAQWHGWPDGYPDFAPGTEYWRNPIMALRTTGGKWSLFDTWDSKTNTGDLNNRVYGGSKIWELGAYETGKWVDWVFHIKWSYLSDGILEVWKDGKLVIYREGPNCFNDKKGPYFKMGIYKGWQYWWRNDWSFDVAEDRTLYHDELHVAHGQDGGYDLVSVDGTAVPGTLPLSLNTVIIGDAGDCASNVKITAQGGTPPYVVTVDGNVVDGFVTEKVLTLDAGTHNIVVSDTDPGSNAVATVNVVCALKQLKIEEVQGFGNSSPWLNALVKVSGTVTQVVQRAGFFIQDANAAWSGIWVKTNETDGIHEGNGIVVTGTVFENLKYFENVTTINATEINSVNSVLAVEAVVVASTAEAKNEKYESVLVTLKNVNAKKADATTEDWSIYTEAGNDMVVNDWLYSYIPNEGNLYNVTGIVNGQFNLYRLEPRKASDVVELVPCNLAVETNVVKGECSSVVEILVTGGVAPYKVTVNGTEITDMVQTLADGSYKIVVTDANTGCIAETTVNVVSYPSETRTATDTTFIGERVVFIDAEAGINTKLTEGVYNFTYNFGVNGCTRTLIVTIIGIPRPLTIVEVQGGNDVSPWLGSVVSVAGTVTHVVNNAGFFMQDANVPWGGIWVTTNETTGINEGNGVEVTGTVVENLKYFESVTTINAIEVSLVNSGLTVEAIDIASPAEAEDEKYESVLVTIKSATATAADKTTGDWIVYKEENSDLVVNNWLYSYTPTEGNLYNVTGVVNGQNDAFKLEPRKDVDIVDLTKTGLGQTLTNEQFKVYPNPFEDKIYIDSSRELKRVFVSNIAGQRVIDVEYPGREIRTDNLVSGIYIVSMFSENGIAKVVRIVKR